MISWPVYVFVNFVPALLACRKGPLQFFWVGYCRIYAIIIGTLKSFILGVFGFMDTENVTIEELQARIDRLKE